MSRSYCGIGVYGGKTPMNLGTLWRSAYNFGASFIFTVAGRYHHQASDTVKAYRHIPFLQYKTLEAFLENRLHDCRLIGVEIAPGAMNLVTFVHPERALYVLGPEDGGLPKELLDKCQAIVYIPSKACLNQAVAGSIVLYDRLTKHPWKEWSTERKPERLP